MLVQYYHYQATFHFRYSSQQLFKTGFFFSRLIIYVKSNFICTCSILTSHMILLSFTRFIWYDYNRVCLATPVNVTYLLTFHLVPKQILNHSCKLCFKASSPNYAYITPPSPTHINFLLTSVTNLPLPIAQFKFLDSMHIAMMQLFVIYKPPSR